MKITRLILENFANIYTAMNKKKIDIDFSKCKNNITIITGHNGSGKTSSVEAIDILKSVLLGQKLSNNIRNLISYDKKYCGLKLTFLIKIDKNKYIVKYGFK